MISLCNNWEYTPEWSEDFLKGTAAGETVRLPHCGKEVPLHYALPSDYERVCGYRRTLKLPAEAAGKRIFLQFDGAAHQTEVYVNGSKAGEYHCGYTAFRVEVTDLVSFDTDNVITVKLDSREDPKVPPFGFVIDYLTFSGLYREVWLDIREKDYISDVYVTTPNTETVSVNVETSGRARELRLSVLQGDTCLMTRTADMPCFTMRVPGVKSWSPDHPHLYICRVELLNDDGTTADRVDTTFGFRTAEFRADGFYLNGEKLFIRGLNRHQSFPYVGYAAPESLQREDARILKEELQCNAVRTSHYPQSQHFIDACDRLGLLVFTELPGWQHVGGEKWKQQALQNVEDMVLQYRNHPSIILWGVRINESQDDDGFYSRSNNLCRSLDGSRATSGVRYIEKSSLLEDVYAYNDFSHNGTNAGVRPKKSVTPDMGKALLISECNGHMYPTKSCDDGPHRQEQALRHARVLNDAMADGEHVGLFGWCMFDYPTHKDFGAGDRICYHGVLDSFRNPKLAAALYASQGEGAPVLEIGSDMNIGDYPAGNIGKIYAFTNADSVRLYKNDCFVAEFTAKDWSGLTHGPVLIDDTIGQLLETQEGFPHAKAELLRRCLVSAGEYGMANMPAADKLRMARAMVQFGLTFEDGVALYGKYVGNWGGEATRWRFEAVKDGQAVMTRTCCPGSCLHLTAEAGSTDLREGNTYDMTAVRIRIEDESGNIAHYAQLPLQLKVSGDAELVGPDLVTAEGGMCGTYLRTAGKSGEAVLTISTPGLESISLSFTVKAEEA